MEGKAINLNGDYCSSGGGGGDAMRLVFYCLFFFGGADGCIFGICMVWSFLAKRGVGGAGRGGGRMG